MSIPMHQLPEQQPTVWQPASVEEALRLKRQWGEDAVIVAGGTWLRTSWENGLTPMPQHLISLGRILALSGLTVGAEGQVHIGPALNIADLMRNGLVKQRCALLVQACAEIAAPSIRNLASVGGNVMTRTGDLIPALLAMDAQVRRTNGTTEQTTLLSEWLTPTNAQGQHDELMTGILVPAKTSAAASERQEKASRKHEFYLKVGRREAFTPSVVTVAGRLTLEPDGTIAHIAIAVGGGSAVPSRLTRAEAGVVGKPLSKSTLKALHQDVMADFQAVADDYAGVSYRKQTAANLIISECYKAWRKGGGGHASQP
ncbi:FAD binding domain-containing protein [Paenibacillus roseipurpureus]|uniref:FAD binding domain-containing protein n=1 Tax=Paenibacillus roseopurpureus TaxID=2918901 RepID=A0AA96RN60_9BACL|nr:FAD binding domain-containing protein [Paenibacillus sp. MBLB1832]WNR45067.1 FAD binding domain-containing protein [Paenibacillus sp. MBLB1832]